MPDPKDPTVPTTPKDAPRGQTSGGETNDIRPADDTPETEGRGERNRSPDRGRNRDNIRGH